MAHRNRGLAHHDLGELDAALSDFDRAIQIDPSSAEPWFLKGNLLMEKDDYAQAERAFSAAIRLDLLHARAYNNRSEALRKLGREADAGRDHARARQIDPSLDETRVASRDASAGRGDSSPSAAKGEPSPETKPDDSKDDTKVEAAPPVESAPAVKVASQDEPGPSTEADPAASSAPTPADTPTPASAPESGAPRPRGAPEEPTPAPKKEPSGKDDEELPGPE